MTLGERFWTKVEKADGCWLWKGSRTGSMGYGYLHYGGKHKRSPKAAHRVSWELHNGEIPRGFFVLHKCDVPACVNPEHLFLGTREDNMRDAARKGRLDVSGSAKRTHCKRGHVFTLENTYRNPKGHRRCRACQRAKAIRERK